MKVAENDGSCIKNLQCTYCGKKFNADSLQTTCASCGKVLYPRYDLEKAKESISKASIQSRKVYNIWRLNEIMPVKDRVYRISLGEGWAPIIKLNNLGKKYGLRNLFLKDEGKNPTGSFKARGLCAAVAKGLELGISDFVMPSAGNAGAALAAYASHAGAKAHIFVPTDTVEFIQKEIKALGGELTLVDGFIGDAGAKAKEISKINNWFLVSTLKEPYRVEGKKTMGFELAEQFNWELPDVIIYPTGGGTGIVGMWKAFEEMETLGLIGNERPKMISVQPSGCQPIVRAFENNEEFATPWENPNSIFGGIRVPSAIGDYLILNAIRESKGTAISVDDKDIKNEMFNLAKSEGIMVSGEAAATVAAVKKLSESGFFGAEETILLFDTATGLTTPSFW